MENKFLLTQNQTASYFKTLEEAVAAIQFEDAEVWERDFQGCYIKIYLE